MTSPRLPSPRALICDLDQTLVDTRALKTLRSRRAWNQVYAGISRCSPVPGVHEFMKAIAPLPVAVVTNSPSVYAEKVLAHFNLPHDHLVAYHDVKNRKPHPEPFHLALQKLGLAASDVWSIGDQPEDVIASRAAGIRTIVALSAACDDLAALLSAKPHLHVRDWTGLSLAIRG